MPEVTGGILRGTPSGVFPQARACASRSSGREHALAPARPLPRSRPGDLLPLVGGGRGGRRREGGVHGVPRARDLPRARHHPREQQGVWAGSPSASVVAWCASAAGPPDHRTVRPPDHRPPRAVGGPDGARTGAGAFGNLHGMTATLWPDAIGRCSGAKSSRPTWWKPAMSSILAGEATDAQIAAFAVGMRGKGETPAELATLVRTMLGFAERGRPRRSRPAADRHLRHRRRSCRHRQRVDDGCDRRRRGWGTGRQARWARRSSQCGSTDVLEALGVVIDLGPEMQAG